MIEDAYSQWERHERELERRLLERPVCKDCGESIQDDHGYLIEGGLVCPDCLEMNYRKDID